MMTLKERKKLAETKEAFEANEKVNGYSFQVIQFKLSAGKFAVSATLLGPRERESGREDVQGGPHMWEVNKFIISIGNQDARKSEDFDFYASRKDFEDGKKSIHYSELPWIFSIILEDGISGSMEVGEFASEYGYDDVGKAVEVHAACKESLRKLQAIGFTVDTLYDTVNELREAFEDYM